MKFGFLPYDEEFIYDQGFIPFNKNIIIKPLPNIYEIHSDVINSGQLSDGWIYPTLKQSNLNFNERRLGIQSAPMIPNEILIVPNTHEITKNKSDNKYLEYIIKVYGFSLGMNLIPDGWCHFYKTPYEKYKLTDFICTGQEQKQLLWSFKEFYINNCDRIRKLFFGVLNLYLNSQSYIHPFEIFGFQYTVLDSLAKLLSIARNLRLPNSHGKRPKFLSDELGIPLPEWGKYVDNKGSIMSGIRNPFEHEGLFFDEPIGFANPSDRIVMELTHFNCRSIIAITGLECGYIHTESTGRTLKPLDS